jgi:outer membrane immunogenic protein
MTTKEAMRGTICVIALATGLATGGAYAADLPIPAKAAPTYPPVLPVFSWTGFYAGANVGGAFGTDNALTDAFGTGGGKIHGVLGGLQAGYNYQLSPMFVVGIENDLDVTGIKNSDSWTGPSASVPWFGTGRARAGVTVFDSHFLMYGTAGLASGELKDAPVHKMKMGWTAGGGVEWAFLPQWSAKLEYLYLDFKHDGLPDWREAEFHTVKIGLNYHFDLLR